MLWAPKELLLHLFSFRCCFQLKTTVLHHLRKREQVTLKLLITGSTGLRGALRILKPNAPVTNSSKAWSGYSCHNNTQHIWTFITTFDMHLFELLHLNLYTLTSWKERGICMLEPCWLTSIDSTALFASLMIHD